MEVNGLMGLYQVTNGKGEEQRIQKEKTFSNNTDDRWFFLICMELELEARNALA